MTPQLRGPGRPKGRKTLAGEIAARLSSRAAEVCPIDDGATWPSAAYQADPVGFCRDKLGVQPWHKQEEVLEALRDHFLVSVVAGRKVGKSMVAAMAALWFYSSFPDGAVYLCAPTTKQIDRIVWKEVKRLHERSLVPLSGTPRQKSASGLTSADGRTILGSAAVRTEHGQGYSGPQLYVVDESSAKAVEAMLLAIEGNRAGSRVYVLLIGNGTRNEGYFYETHTGRPGWFPISISSEESPNVVSGEDLIPDMATRRWVQQMEETHGRNSPFFKVHVLGQFVESEEGKIVSLADIEAAEKRWPETDAIGPLVIGLDPAGKGVGGDESVFAVRRGQKALEFEAHRGITAEAHLVHLNGLIDRHANSHREVAIVVLDREGSVGAEIYGTLKAAAALEGARFRVIGVRSSDRAQRNPLVYERVRDELWAAVAQWIVRDGGAIPENTKLPRDLHAPAWGASHKNRQIVTDKKELRKDLGRSPDHADALCLACWIKGDEADPSESRTETPRVQDMRQQSGDMFGRPAIDPFGARSRVHTGRGMLGGEPAIECRSRPIGGEHVSAAPYGRVFAFGKAARGIPAPNGGRATCPAANDGGPLVPCRSRDRAA